MAIIYSYPLATPADADLVLGSRFDPAKPQDGNATKSFLMADSKNLHKLIYKFDGEPEDYPELFEKIDEVRDILIRETIRIMEEKGMEFDDSNINRVFQKVCSSIVQLFVSLYGTYFKK